MYLLCACCCISCAFHVLSPVNFPCAFAESAAGYFSAAIAACSINRPTSAGCEMNGTWLDLISVVFAPMRFAKNRSRIGFSAWSSCAMMYHEGIVNLSTQKAMPVDLFEHCCLPLLRYKSY